MTIDEKKNKLFQFCGTHSCLSCVISHNLGGCLDIEDSSERKLDKALELIGCKIEPTETNNTPIKDSDNRREFTSGAVRDMAEGKGRCDLLPLDILAEHFTRQGLHEAAHVFIALYEYQQSGNTDSLYDILENNILFSSQETMLLDLAKHYENGAKKYGENNWQKGIDTWSYIDSAGRHYLKTLRGDNDEPHSAAFIWNIVACIWTCKHKPEFNTYRKASENEK